MGRASKPRWFRTTSTSQGTVNVEDLDPVAATTGAVITAVAAFTGVAGPSGIRFNPGVASSSTAAAPPSVGTARVNEGWRDIATEASTITPDSSSNGRHGALTGSTLATLVTSARSGFGNALLLDGVDRDENTSAVVYAPAGLMPTSGFTARVKFTKTRETSTAGSSDGTNCYEMLCGTWSGVANATCNHILYLSYEPGSYSGNRLKCAWIDSAQVTQQIFSNVTVSIAEHEAEMCLVSGTMYLLLDGVVVASQASTTIRAADAGVPPFQIGRFPSVSSTSGAPYAFAGRIDEVEMSDIGRHSAGYTVSTSPATADSNTLLLWKFDSTLATTVQSTDTYQYAAGQWLVKISFTKTGQTIPVDITVRATAIVYRVTSSGGVPGSGVHEIGRITFTDSTLSTATLTLIGSFSTGSSTSFDSGDKIQIEAYVQTVTAGTVTAPATTVNVNFIVEEANLQTGICAVPDFKVLAGRTVTDTNALTEALSRATTYGRAFTESIPFTEALTRVKGAIRGLAESISLTETLARIVGAIRGLTESIALTESLTRTTAYRRTNTEAIPTTDSTVRGVGYSRKPTENLAGPVDIIASDPARVFSGVARDGTGSPLSGVTVYLVRKIAGGDWFKAQEMVTGADGAYSFARDRFDTNTYFVVTRKQSVSPNLHGVSDDAVPSLI